MFRKLRKIRKDQKGFTLVEVIVVAVIVAVLAAVAIPLYIGYVNDSRLAAADNAAGSLASFVSSGINSGATGIAGWGGSIVAGVTISYTMPAGWAGGTAPTWIVPQGVTITTTGTGLATPGTIVATIRGMPGATHNY